jgi:hypothetical protein
MLIIKLLNFTLLRIFIPSAFFKANRMSSYTSAAPTLPPQIAVFGIKIQSSADN